MRIKKDDKVKILQGKDRGKMGKVIQIFTQEGKASVEGLNLHVKHLRPGKQREKGQKIQFPSPLTLSKLMLVCPKCHKPTRVSFKILENEQKIRLCKKCHEAI